MALLDAPLRNVASKLIPKFGKAATLEINRQKRYDTTTGKSLGGFAEEVGVHGIIGEFRRDELGDLVRATDLKFEIAAKGIPEPNPKDTVLLDGVRHQVVQVRPVMSGAEAATYTLALRR